MASGLTPWYKTKKHRHLLASTPTCVEISTSVTSKSSACGRPGRSGNSMNRLKLTANHSILFTKLWTRTWNFGGLSSVLCTCIEERARGGSLHITLFGFVLFPFFLKFSMMGITQVHLTNINWASSCLKYPLQKNQMTETKERKMEFLGLLTGKLRFCAFDLHTALQWNT